MITKSYLPAIGLVFLLASSSFGQESSRAYAKLKDKNGKSVGTANFREGSGGVVIQLQVKGMSPVCTRSTCTPSENVKIQASRARKVTSIPRRKSMA
jgi:Cu/Zn superoxide dismutase